MRVGRLVKDLVPGCEHEGIVRHGQRDALRAGERAQSRRVPGLGGAKTLSVVLQAHQVNASSKCSLEEDLHRDRLRSSRRRHGYIFSLARRGRRRPLSFGSPRQRPGSRAVPGPELQEHAGGRFAVSRSPAKSTSGDITSCASAKSSVESLLWRRKSGFVATYCISFFGARSCEAFHDDTFDASRVIATVMSGRLRRAANSSFSKCEEHVADCSPAYSPPFDAKSQMFPGRWHACLVELRRSYLRGVDRRRILHEVLHLDGETDEVAIPLEDVMGA